MHTTHANLPPRPEMARALMARDASYDGVFCFAVTTTGVFCRPSCPARRPRPEHIEYYSTPREALFAGFRPCGRCRPLEDPERTPDWASRLIARVEADPTRRLTDAELRREGTDPAAARRVFKRAYGLTFQAYARARRLGSAFTAIRAGASLDDAGLGHDWESLSGFREAFAKTVGVAPGAARGTDLIRLAWVETSLGPMVAGATDDAVCLLEFTDRRMLEAQLDTVKRRFRLPLVPAESPLLDRLREQLGEYLAGRRRSFDLPLAYPGTNFQRRVWEALLRIPYGETRTYGELAGEIGEPRAVRAVGRANGLNRIAILIPCHRATNADGGLGGYGGGLWRKLRLLETEAAGRQQDGPPPASGTGRQTGPPSA